MNLEDFLVYATLILPPVAFIVGAIIQDMRRYKILKNTIEAINKTILEQEKGK